ncbi:MAG: cell division protein ZapA [Brachymonas sp.]|nr:cell division protein ZapA [Brachymonas sp.]
MKQIEAHIMGQTYMLACPPGSEQTMEQAVQRVDAAMCKIRDAGKIRARDRIAVLAALNLAFDVIAQESAPRAAPATPAADTNGTSTNEGLVHPRVQALLQRMQELLAEDGKLL